MQQPEEAAHRLEGIDGDENDAAVGVDLLNGISVTYRVQDCA